MSEPKMYAHETTSIGEAWSRAFLELCEPSTRELSPFLVSISMGQDGRPRENLALRAAIDDCLEESGFDNIEKVAKSIFPHPLWSRANGDRQSFFKSYKDSLPDYVAMEPTKNKLGIYFARLVGFGINHKTGDDEKHLPSATLEKGGNQLEFIINALKPRAQRMALQAAIFDPVRDQKAARRSFPCLQQVAFVPDSKRKTLSLNAFYPLQSLYVKAYGNWLGLCRLGEFVASQADPALRFERLNCYAGIQQISSKAAPKPGPLLDELKRQARSCIATLQPTAKG